MDEARWDQDVNAISLYGLDGIWIVNDPTGLNSALNSSSQATSWNATNLTHLTNMMSYAQSLNEKVLIGMAYGWPGTGSWFVDHTQFQYYLDYVTKIVQQTSSYSNVVYVFCNEEMWPTSLYSDPKDTPALVQNFHDLVLQPEQQHCLLEREMGYQLHLEYDCSGWAWSGQSDPSKTIYAMAQRDDPAKNGADRQPCEEP